MLKQLVHNYWRWLALGLVVANIALGYQWLVSADPLFHIYFLNVGEGDAILLRTPDQRFVLIDGGPTSRTVYLLDQVIPAWRRRLALIVLTHPHADHAAGLVEIAKRYPIDEFLFNGSAYSTETYQALLSQINLQHIPTNVVDPSDRYNFDGVSLAAIYPPGPASNVSDDPNTASIVLAVNYQGFSGWLMGDAGSEAEKQLIAEGKTRDIDILKVAHQGSQTASSPEFLASARPEVAVVSVGKNNFGHPHQIVLDRLQQSGAQVFRTDQDGMVEVVTDGQRYRVLTHAS
ncbi:MAG: ComEC/Rec2 family competence protein [bacterium]